MPFTIIWSESAVRQLGKLDRSVARRIFDRVSQLSLNPYRSVRRLSGVSAYRLRVGDFRVIVDIQQAQLRVLVLQVGHREAVYR